MTVPFSRAEEDRLIKAAQAGCQTSLNRLMAGYEAGVQQLVASHGHWPLSEEEACQAGREGLWQAILSYQVSSPERLWTLRWAMGRVWCAILGQAKRVEWQQRRASWHLRALDDDLSQADPALDWEKQQLPATLAEMVAALPAKLRQVVVAYYGLEGQPPASSAQIGQALGFSRQWVWHLRQEALARLSHPSASYQLRSLLGAHSLADYLAAQRRVRSWLRQRGGRRRETDDGQRP
jgi:RNA polymerase sigma factor (sigma-70 family)